MTQIGNAVRIHEGKAEIAEIAGMRVVSARGNAKAGRPARTVQFPEYDLGEVPEEFREMIRTQLDEQVRKTLHASQRESIPVSLLSAESLAEAWNAENLPVDWSAHLEKLESLLRVYLSSRNVPEGQGKKISAARIAQFKLAISAAKRGEEILVDIKNTLLLALAKLAEWSGLPEWAIRELEMWSELVTELPVTSEGDII